jgi:hypothetical protein
MIKFLIKWSGLILLAGGVIFGAVIGIKKLWAAIKAHLEIP